jgi:hypothetical protein
MNHPLDDWDNQATESQREFAENSLRQSSLVYQVFSTAAGQELIAEWKELLINSPSAHAGADMLTIGINEGNKAFMRSIIQAVKTHEEAQ